jgi:hypothetical protein
MSPLVVLSQTLQGGKLLTAEEIKLRRAIEELRGPDVASQFRQHHLRSLIKQEFLSVRDLQQATYEVGAAQATASAWS